MKGSVSHNSAFVRNLLNKMFIKSAGGCERPPLLDSSVVFPESKIFESNFNLVREEVMSLVDARRLTRYEDIDPVRAKEVSLNWKLYYIKLLGDFNEDAKLRCPKIVELVQRISSAYNVTIAVLDPGVELAAHKGPYAGILRYHLGIKVPKNNPPYIRVHTESHTWQEGKSIVIDDVFEHEVINKSDDIRVILMIDFLRPMGPILTFLNKASLYLKRKWGRYLIAKANPVD